MKTAIAVTCPRYDGVSPSTLKTINKKTKNTKFSGRIETRLGISRLNASTNDDDDEDENDDDDDDVEYS